MGRSGIRAQRDAAGERGKSEGRNPNRDSRRLTDRRRVKTPSRDSLRR
jgi:hypothetical protein